MVCVALALTATTGCVHDTLSRAERARVSGDLAEAERILGKVSERGLDETREEAEKRMLDLSMERILLMETLQRGALAVQLSEGHRVADALAWYEAGRSLALPSDTLFVLFDEQASALGAEQAALLEEHVRRQAALSRVARDCKAENPVHELAGLIESARLAAEPPPTDLAWSLANACFESLRYEEAASVAERASRLQMEPYKPALESRALLRLALSLQRTNRLDELGDHAFGSEPEAPSLGADQACIPREPGPRVVRQPAGSRQARSDRSAAEPSPAPLASSRAVSEAVARARRLRSQGDLHGALLHLDVSLQRHSAHPDSARIAELLSEWEADRAGLMRGYLARAESALASQRPDEAMQLYEQILELEPAHVLSRDRLRRLEHLRSIRESP